MPGSPDGYHAAYSNPNPAGKARKIQEPPVAKESFENLIEQFSAARQVCARELGKAIVGQAGVLDQMFAAILCRGH